MPSYRRALLLSATAASLTVAAVVPAGASAASPDASLRVVSTVPLVGTTTSTTLPLVTGLEGLTSVLSTVSIVGGAELASILSILPPLPIVEPIVGETDPLASLTSLLPALTDLSSGLPVDGLPAGTVPTGTALAPVTALLRQIATAVAGTPLSGALVSLADQIDAIGDGGVSPDLLSVLASTLGSVAATPGVPAEVRTVAGTLAGQLAPKPVATTTTPKPATTTSTPMPGATTSPRPGASATGAAAVGRARLASLRINRKTGKVRIVVSCPATGPACKTIILVLRGKTSQNTPLLLRVGAGRSVTRNVKVNAASRRLLKRKTVRFSVTAVLPGGKLTTRTVTAKLPKAKQTAKR